MSAVYVIVRDTAAEGRALRDRIVDQIDREAAENWCHELGLESGSFDDHTLEMIALGAGAMPIVGDCESVTDELAKLYEAGVDGALMSYPDYLEDTQRIGREIVPRLRARGLLCPAP